MALEKITIATEEKQDDILRSISNIPSLFIQLIGELAKKTDLEKIELAIIENGKTPFLQIKTDDSTKESNCKYLLIGVTTKQDRIFDSLTATDTSGGLVDRAECMKCISDRSIKIFSKTFYLLSKTLIVTKYDMYGSESALMVRLEK